MLLHGRAGAGKSSCLANSVTQWAQGELQPNITCVLFLTAGSDEPIALPQLLWLDYPEAGKWSLEQAGHVFNHLQHLADHQMLAIVIDGLDEMGSMSEKDINLDQRAKIDIKTLCVGTISRKILRGSRVIASGRNVQWVNQTILHGEAELYELADLEEEDHNKMIEIVDPDEQEQV